MIDLVGQSHFFIGAIMGLGINRAVGLAIIRIVLTGTDIAIGFFELFL